MLELLLPYVPAEDREQFSEMYYKYRDLVNLIVYSHLKHKEDTEDCIQEIFTYFTQYFDDIRLKDEETLKGYICIVSKALAITFYRKRQNIDNKRSGYFEKMKERINDEAFNIYSAVDLEKAMAQLTEEEDFIIQMKCVYGMTSKEMGEALGISDTYARKKYERAKKKLIKILNKQ